MKARLLGVGTPLRGVRLDSATPDGSESRPYLATP